MRLNQIIIFESYDVDFSGIDSAVVDMLKGYPSHFQQWGVDSIRKGFGTDSVLDAMSYYKAKISDNRFIEILKKISPTPRNILSLSLDQIKSAQSEFDSSFGGASKRELKKLRRGNYVETLVDEKDLKIIKFSKVDETDGAAKILSDYARGTKWCVTDVSTGDDYLKIGPIYLIYKSMVFYTNRDEMQIIDTNDEQLPRQTDKSLCHIQTMQLMDPSDTEMFINSDDVNDLKSYIPHIGIFNSRQLLRKSDWNRRLRTGFERIRDRSANPFARYGQEGVDWSVGLDKDVVDYLKAGLEVPDLAVKTCIDVGLLRWPEAEASISKDPSTAVAYAQRILESKWPEAEPAIATDGRAAMRYLLYFDINGFGRSTRGASRRGSGWPEAEAAILKIPDSALEYAQRVIERRWPEAEQALFAYLDRSKRRNDYNHVLKIAINYAEKFYKDGWPRLEPYLASSHLAGDYCGQVIKRRWPEVEPYIIKDAFSAAHYAIKVLGKRWPEAEPVIIKSDVAWNMYRRAFKLWVGQSRSNIR
jgi:hypothetical protein